MAPLRVKEWDVWFENNKSRTYKNKSQVSMPNKHGLGYRRLLRMPNGEAMFGAWCAMIQVLSRHQFRDGWLTENGKKSAKSLGPVEISDLTLFSEATCKAMLQACSSESVDWLIVTEAQEAPRTPDGHQTDTTVPLQGACRAVDRIGLDRTGQEGVPRASEEVQTPGEAGSAAAGAVLECTLALARLHECGDQWRNRLSLEHLVEIVRSHPKANLSRVVDRIRKDWKDQPLPANKTPPMVVRQCLEWDEADGLSGSGVNRFAGKPRKNSAGLPDAEDLRMARLSQPRVVPGDRQ